MGGRDEVTKEILENLKTPLNQAFKALWGSDWKDALKALFTTTTASPILTNKHLMDYIKTVPKSFGAANWKTVWEALRPKQGRGIVESIQRAANMFSKMQLQAAVRGLESLKVLVARYAQSLLAALGLELGAGAALALLAALIIGLAFLVSRAVQPGAGDLAGTWVVEATRTQQQGSSWYSDAADHHTVTAKFVRDGDSLRGEHFECSRARFRKSGENQYVADDNTDRNVRTQCFLLVSGNSLSGSVKSTIPRTSEFVEWRITGRREE